MAQTELNQPYRIKQIPEDFRVTELPNLTLNPQGVYTYFILQKQTHTTLSAIKALSWNIHVPFKSIGFSGNKDKHAITEQTCSIKGDFQTQLRQISIPGIHITPIGRGDQPLRLGDLLGNRFSITVREIHTQPTPLNTFINYFGPQRFSKTNPLIGHALVTRRYHDAITLICESNPKAADTLHSYVGEHPRDPIGCLRTLPKTLLMLFVHSYQSLLWNQTVQEYLKCHQNSLETIPLIGFNLTYTNSELKSIIESIMEREGIRPSNFIFRDMPELCSEGGERSILVFAKELLIGELSPNTIGPGLQCTISFTLPPGSYATTYLEQLFNPT